MEIKKVNLDDLDSYQDRNGARCCACDWEGIVHDMKGKDDD